MGIKGYYDENDKIISDKSTVFNPDDEIIVKIGFTLSSDAYAAGKRNFTVRFKTSVGFDGRILYANSSSTSEKDFTATYTVDDRNAKKCEVEARITVRFSHGSLNVAYSYDGEEFSDVMQTPLNNDKTLAFQYDAETDGYKVSKDPENDEWFDKSAKLTFPDSFAGKPVTIIDGTIFKNCTNLTSISVPSSVKSIGDYDIFDNCPIEEATLPPEFVGYMPKSTLKRVKLVGDGSIGWNYDDGTTYSGFKNCANLTSVELSDDIGGIVNNAFEGCDKLQYNEYNGARYLGNAKNPYVALVSVTSKFLSYTDVHEKTKVICDNAFEYYSNLKGITLYDGLRVVGKNAFMHCGNLESINVPDSVTKIDDAFWGCNNLKYNEYGNALYLGNEKNPYTALVTVDYRTTSVEMHPSTRVILNGLFAKRENLTSVTIDGVTSIDDGAFKECAKLESVTIRSAVTSIGEDAFRKCSSLTSITMPSGITGIERGTFEECSSLTDISIPDGVTSIGEYAFDGCIGLTSVIIPDGITKVGTGAFYNCDNLQYNEYGNARYLGNATNPYRVLIAAINADVTSVDINENTKVIADYAFSLRKELKSVTIPGSVIHVESKAFYGCDGLDKVTIEDGVKSIGNYAFSRCDSVDVVIPRSVTFIGSDLFSSGHFVRVHYEGTMKEWLNFASSTGVVVEEDGVPVKCSDGEISFKFY